MAKKITILGQKVNIEFNLAVQLAYEKITNQPFNTKDLVMQTNASALYMAAILANNPKTKITYDQLIKKAKGPEIDALGKAVMGSMAEWLEMPELIKETEPPSFEESQGEAKNQ